MKHLMEEKIGLTTQGSDGLVEHEIQHLTAQLVLPLNMISRFVHSGDCAGKKPLPWNRDKNSEVIVWISCCFQAYICDWACNLETHRSEASVSVCRKPTGEAEAVVEAKQAVWRWCAAT